MLMQMQIQQMMQKIPKGETIMSMNIKHVGKLVNTGKKVVVVFRELPMSLKTALVVDTDALPDWMHDDIIGAVELRSPKQVLTFMSTSKEQLTDGSKYVTNITYTLVD